MSTKLQLSGPEEERERNEERKAELTEHLAELRTRLIRACIYVAVGMAVMYVCSKPLFSALSAPITETLAKMPKHPAPGLAIPNGGFLVRSFTDLFFVKLQIATFGGLVLALPFIVLELWGFISPALTPQEKRGVHFVAPMSVVLFAMGTTCAYLILPMAVKWFLSFMADFPGAVLYQDPLTYIVFTIKLLFVFGLLFELPVVLMFLGKVGIINSALMIRYWRQIAVGLFTLAMVVAPSNDPGTMLALAIPLTLLFFGSIGLVKLVEPKGVSLP